MRFVEFTEGKHQYWAPAPSSFVNWYDDLEDADVEDIRAAPRPFVMFGLPMNGALGVPIDTYCLTMRPADYTPRQWERFEKCAGAWLGTTYGVLRVKASDVGAAWFRCLAPRWMRKFDIKPVEVEDGLRWWQDRGIELVTITVKVGGQLAFTELDYVDHPRKQLQGVLCEWSDAFQKRSPGIWACYLAAAVASEEFGMDYGLGIEYPYKLGLATGREQMRGLCLAGKEHLHYAEDKEGPMSCFAMKQVNGLTSWPRRFVAAS